MPVHCTVQVELRDFKVTLRLICETDEYRITPLCIGLEWNWFLFW